MTNEHPVTMHDHPFSRHLRLASGLFLAGALIFRLVFVWSDPVRATTKVIDDAYYNLVVARNFAQGEGLTFDGTSETNGFHPMVLLAMAPVYRFVGDDSYLPVQMLLTLQIGMFVLAGVFLGSIARILFGPVASFLTVATWACSDVVVTETMNGCDTIFAVVFGVVAIWYYLARVRARDREGLREVLILGVWIGLAALARIDHLALLPALLLDQAIVRARGGAKEWRRRLLRDGLAVSLCALTVLSPWLLFNIVGAGSPLPDNGRAVRYIGWLFADVPLQIWDAVARLAADKQIFAYLQWPFGTGRLFEVLSVSEATARATGLPGEPLHGLPPAFYLFNTMAAVVVVATDVPVLRAVQASVAFVAGEVGLLPLVVLGLSSATVLLYLTLRRRPLAAFFKDAFRRGALVLVVFPFLIAAAYIFYIFGQWFYSRYLFPVTMALILLVSAVGAFVVQGPEGEKRPRAGLAYKARSLHMQALLIVLLTIPMICLAFQNGRFLWRCASHYILPTAWWIEENLPAEARIGATGSGTFAYYCPQRVFNLDGKVSRTAFLASKEKRVLDYILEQRIDYIVDWPLAVRLAIEARSEEPWPARLEEITVDRKPDYYCGIQLYRVVAEEGYNLKTERDHSTE